MKMINTRMRNVLMLAIFLTMSPFQLPGTFASQIEKTIDIHFGKKIVYPYSETRFSAQITFDPLPELLKTSTVDVKIMAMCDLDFDPEFIVITAYNNLIEFTQLTPTIWTPPIRKGDIYEGKFTITPTEIGKFHIEIVPKAPPIKLKERFGFFLTIDESGKLVHLSMMRDFDYTETAIHPPVVGNEIKLKYRVSKNLDGYVSDDFINIFNISPLPALNETSTVRFELTANRECPEGVQFRLSCRGNIELLGIPKSWIGEINIGEVHIDSLKIVPRSTGCGWFELWARAHSTPEETRPAALPDEASESYRVTFFVDESGKLTFIGREPTKIIQEACPYAPYKHKTYVSEPTVFTKSRRKRKE
jgi:hypothetical protein